MYIYISLYTPTTDAAATASATDSNTARSTRACQNILVHRCQILASVIKHRAQWLVLSPNDDKKKIPIGSPQTLHTRYPSCGIPCKHQPWRLLNRPGNTAS